MPNQALCMFTMTGAWALDLGTSTLRDQCKHHAWLHTCHFPALHCLELARQDLTTGVTKHHVHNQPIMADW